VLRLNAKQSAAEAELKAATEAVKSELDAIDLACSRFRDDSELARVNGAGGRRVAVSELLLEALEVAIAAARLTDGLVDPCLGRALQLAGYDRDFALLAPPISADSAQEDQPSPATPPRVAAVRVRIRDDWRAVELDRNAGTVRLPKGVALDLGATAKAWAADRAALAAADASGLGALVSLGGDIAVSGPAPTAGWAVRVTDDHSAPPSAPGQTVALRGGGLASSSVTVRRWLAHGRAMHHIIDPRSGEPARGEWRTASVTAASCTDANIASTSSILLSRQAPAWLLAAGLSARLVAHDGEVVTVGGWPESARLQASSRSAHPSLASGQASVAAVGTSSSARSTFPEAA
jgi:thiamine biosynthesis lipoprotein